MSGATVKLSAPITAHGEQVSEITLRQPTVKDMMDLNQPFLIIMGDGETGIRIQQKVVGQYIVRLAGIPMSSVESLAPADFSQAQAAVLGFFGASGDGQPSS